MIRQLFTIVVVASALGGVPSGAFAQTQLTPNDPGFTQQWYLSKIHAPQAWDRGAQLRGSLGQGSADVIIAVIDSGVDIDHPDLVGNIWTNPREIPENGIDDDRNGYIDDVHGWDFLTNTNDPKPKIDTTLDLTQTPLGVHHGTIIAGLAAAVGNNQEGLAGVVWHSSILPLRVIRSDGSGEADQVARAMDYAVAQGARVINLSFVGDTNTSVLANAITRAERSGVLIVAAAGNQSRTDGSVHVFDLDATPLYPICHDGLSNAVIGVTATDRDDRKSPFASFGTHCIDVSAPGEDLIVTRSTDPQFGPVRLYGSPVEGTSMSTALVSGSAALLKSLFPETSMKRIGEVLIATADPIDTLNPTFIRRMGKGRINLERAVADLAVSMPLVQMKTSVQDEKSVPQSSTPLQHVVVTQRFRSRSTIVVELYDRRGNRLRSVDLLTGWNTLPSIALLSSGQIVLGAPSGQEPWVRVYSPEGVLQHSTLVYPKGMRGGVSVVPYGDLSLNQIAVFPQQNASAQLSILNADLHIISRRFVVDSRIRGQWTIGTIVSDDGKGGVIIIGSHAPERAYVIIPGATTPQVMMLPQSLRVGGWSQAVTISAYRDALGTISVAGGFPTQSQIQVQDRLQEAYPRSYNLSVAVGWVVGDHGAEIDVFPLRGSGHWRIFSPQGDALGQKMLGQPTLRVDWKVSFAHLRSP